MVAILLLISFTFAEPTGILGFLSENQKAGIEEYKRALGKQATYGGNNGLVVYNYELLRKPCFQQVAADFYKEILKDQRIADNRNMQAKAPAGFQPGFVWDIALRHANNDPNLAMALIGICGHDDGEFVELVNSGFTCPVSETTFYTPKSLSESADIPQNLRELILSTQGEGGKADYIPNKYYHLMGAASSSCIMLRRGVPALVARAAVTAAVNGYRSGRICERINGSMAFSDFSETDLRILEYVAYNTETDEVKIALQAKVSAAEFEVFKVRTNFMLYSPDIRRKKAKLEISNQDAQNILLANNAIRKECNTPPNMSATLTGYLKNRSFTKKGECGKLPQERCKEALHRLETWEVDRQWTEAQHLAGFEFARTHCQPTYKDDGALEKSACNVRDRKDVLELESANGVIQK
jgi:hypothetical protein